MTRKIVDDATGLVIETGRYYTVTDHGTGDHHYGDFADLNDVLRFVQRHLEGVAKPYIAISTVYFDETGKNGNLERHRDK